MTLNLSGCGKQSPTPSNRAKTWKPKQSWHANIGWKAEDYFDDPKVVALCNAIEKQNIKEVEKCLADGADAKAIGKGNMTTLLWAFPTTEDIFRTMLEKGADPNLKFTSDFGSQGLIKPGKAVIHMAASTDKPNYFKLVIENGGDINLVSDEEFAFKASPLIIMIERGKKEDVNLAIEKGADINY